MHVNLRSLLRTIAIVAAMIAPTIAGLDDAAAVPAFARKYHVPCSTCHSFITRRNEFGEVFRLNGYRWPENEEVDGAAPAGIEMKGSSLLDGFLSEGLPVAVSITSAASVTFRGKDATGERTPRAVTLGSPTPNLLFGGAISQNVTFFGAWAGQGAPSELVVFIRRLGNRPEFNLRLGRFEQTTTMFKNNEALLSRYQLGTSALSGFALVAGRVGAELSGFLGDQTFYAIGVVQDGGPGTRPDAYYQISHKFGGIDLFGRQPDVDLEDESALDDLAVTVSQWGLGGTVSDPTVGETAAIRRLGADVKVRFRDLEVWSGAMVGRDRNLVLDQREPSLTWFGEASYGVTSWLRPVYLFQYQDSSTFERVRTQHDVGMLLMVHENLRLRAKYTYAHDSATSQGADVQLLMAF